VAEGEILEREKENRVEGRSGRGGENLKQTPH